MLDAYRSRRLGRVRARADPREARKRVNAGKQTLSEIARSYDKDRDRRCPHRDGPRPEGKGLS